jgi:hypothetical protein
MIDVTLEIGRALVQALRLLPHLVAKIRIAQVFGDDGLIRFGLMSRL